MTKLQGYIMHFFENSERLGIEQTEGQQDNSSYKKFEVK